MSVTMISSWNNLSNKFRSTFSRKSNESLTVGLIGDLQPTCSHGSSYRSQSTMPQILNDHHCNWTYNASPGLVQIARPNSSVPLGLEIDEVNTGSPKKRMWLPRNNMPPSLPEQTLQEQSIPGLRVSVVQNGSAAHIAGLKAGDMIVGVNNVSWNDKSPRKCGARLKSELNSSRTTFDLMVLSRN